MINLSQDIQPLTTFKRNTSKLITQMRNTGHPIVLTINGKAELVVQDAISYQQLLNKLEELETIISIKKGLEDLAKGHTRPLNQFVEEIQRKHGISS
ncbi:type II toxin-antitoxin system Phd/YefM family antitoxin [Pseudanabaena sp. ABRG5-3]|uniref:type II toxin-antitoxin system Phd/YefM family antitoxin n=1 Tax=Pseudanabaena sp. ABRG5-3 TaxID=685565 RepID=UPI000DC6D9C8|nr:type II toxin-antitoxin system Phd/YefM family antitoxin [Pseudanabaena sp. ABRG5-3]BBC25792.1 prevent-host-death family protein [Pseudanabaena sp. ABRG5-3]